MKNLFAIFAVLLVASAASATVSLIDFAPGEPGSPENPLSPSDDFVIEIVSDEQLLGLNALITVTGSAEIIGAIGDSDPVVPYGWDRDLSFFPLYGVDNVEIGVGSFTGIGPGVVGYVLFHYTGESDITIELIPAYGFGGSSNAQFEEPDFSAATVLIHRMIPEPATAMLLGLGGLALLRRRKRL